MQWNKDVPPNKEPYKKYKIKTDNMGTIIIKPYYIATFEIDMQVYELYIPNYELDNFIKITGFDYQDELINL